ncbi:MAG: hypothetical protein HN742_29350 [Lentisphaerae bacterium]|jgi:MraZ protein|nr:hypothetical protein [Lentisphaerota bacterium]MBT4818070.1 hypothetical protein [Lentisphaerota bacterium]MBT5610250.1 hypothetical protein [Lentisphaerota bacterium]MBT7055719.1 hypothetical protein [Lentisphaerota bacterium]MBT7846014.1 hypothetical protein [Lentisphaerota bacterium]
MSKCFFGEHENVVDPQRRIALPKAWRSAEPGENEFFLLPGRGQSLQLVPSATFGKLLDKLQDVSFADQQAARALATIGSMAQEIRCDRQGRFSVTPKLLAHADITDRALLLGSVTTIQVWAPAVWREQQMGSEDCLNVLQAIQERPDDFTDIIRKATKD